jgi:ATP-dependent RNA helicase DDX41
VRSAGTDSFQESAFTQSFAFKVSPPLPSFESMRFPPLVLDMLRTLNIKTPTPVQVHLIPVLLEKRDVIVRSSPNSGKTIAYILPIIMQVFNDPNGCIVML